MSINFGIGSERDHLMRINHARELTQQQHQLQRKRINIIACGILCLAGFSMMAALTLSSISPAWVHWATLLPTGISALGSGYLYYANSCKRQVVELERKLALNSSLSNEELDDAIALANASFFYEREDEWSGRILRAVFLARQSSQDK